MIFLSFNRLSEIQSNLLKFRNPDITNLSDHNGLTELGVNFRELYDDEWTDAFEFLTEENDETLRQDKKMEGKRSRVTQLCRDLLWLETEAAVKAEATSVRDKLHQVRENYRKTVNKHRHVKESNELMIEWNEDLLSFCKANRRKYHMEDRTLKLDRQRLEDQRLIAQYEDEVEKLRKELKEATEAKEHELNRNPDITNLSDHNRPTELGENFKELYDNEWTDAFEFLTEENGETLRKDEERCNELCSEAPREQQTSLAQLVSNPAYFKAEFGKTLPATSLSTSDQVSGRRRPLDKQGESKETASNGNKKHSNLKSGKMSAVYETEKMTDATKPIANRLVRAGDYEGARWMSDTARKFIIISVFLGFSLIIFCTFYARQYYSTDN